MKNTLQYYSDAFQCACRELGFCNDPLEVCNCDGASSKRIDNGRILNKTLLPITEIKIRPGSGNIFVNVGDLKCAPKTFGEILKRFIHVPKTFHNNLQFIGKKEALFINGIHVSGPVLMFLLYLVRKRHL